ncbi:hypothetical protein SCLCIDRAFT_1207935 [Scleroderma citrinum Foug A]|uniref:Uncharacterized protein n=1 Tax=Scleroderma citrinum Foug A TaxID=1036808 RepID=A0A0C3EMQ9_9AGAM|nr:hypothetical protein SCLCIDRAFT_1207935 [Scleroderma citrinum Foug A]
MAALDYTPVSIVASRVAMPVCSGRDKLARGTRRHQPIHLSMWPCIMGAVPHIQRLLSW